VMAKAICGDAVTRLASDLNQFRFDAVQKTDDPMMLPGAAKFGGLPAFAAMAAPGEVLLHNHAGTSTGKLTQAAYEAAGAADKLRREAKQLPPLDVVTWLTR